MLRKTILCSFLIFIFIIISISIPPEMYNVLTQIGINYRKNPHVDSQLIYTLDDNFELENGLKTGLTFTSIAPLLFYEVIEPKERSPQ